MCGAGRGGGSVVMAAGTARPVRRSKKVVDYSEFGDDDEDFACIAAPLSKKSRTQLKEPKKEKKEKQKITHKELTPSQKQAPSKRISLDDKLYQRDLEVALALSVKEKPTNILEVQNSEEQGKNIESENRRPVFTNCSVDSELLDEESEEDSDYNEGDDEDFAMEKKKAKGNKKETKQKRQAEKEKKTPTSKINTTVSPVVSPSLITELKSEPTQMSSSSEPIGRPLHASSPVTEKKPKWIPPAASGSTNNIGIYASVKSPTHGLRLGLSRLARVKPLHPSATSS
ncbi:RAD51-associated protein 1 isoform X4 [Anser cygnoides]|uniref:RAD51-associated protein 1 isoform X4 n=1 Tax=Anser cygnoides TaxID=8845 RepID=UPI002009BA21|nr:RAD51-associated protein 1 isoform X3 [Anser cygnoides]